MRRILAAALALCPGAALAHSPVPGIEGFYTGLLHPVSTPAQVLVVLAAGLLVGQFRPPRYALLGPVFAGAALVGLWLGRAEVDYDPFLLILAITAGAWAALLPGRGVLLSAVLVGAVGLGLGMISVPDPGPARDRAITMAGSYVGANLALLYLSGLVMVVPDRLTYAWIPIALRVIAAWVTAISVLLLALIASGVMPAG